MTDEPHGLVCPWCGGRSFVPDGDAAPGRLGGSAVCRDCLGQGRWIRITLDVKLAPSDAETLVGLFTRCPTA